MYDLLLKGGRVIDPGQGLDGELDVAIAGGKIAAVGANIPQSEAARVVDVSGKMVMPGLVDFHCHVYWGATRSGIDPDEYMLKRGITTVVDGGSAGSDNFAGFVKYAVGGSRTRIYGLVHLSCLGLVGNRKVGELVNHGYADPEGAAAMLRKYPEVALGLKIRLSEEVVGGPCLPLLKMAREVADEVGVPLTVHVGNTVEPLGEIVQLLKAGDIVAHYMTGRRNGSLDSEGRVFPQLREARERGVLFDLCTGRSHFTFPTAERLLDQGFLPDAIGTDLSGGQLPGPLTDMPTLMSRLVMMGMPLADLVALATSRNARLLGKADLFGSLKPGLEADVAVFQWEDGEFPHKDTAGEIRIVPRRLDPCLVVKAGEIVE